MFRCSLLLLGLITSLLAFAQGTVRGKVSDPTGETIIGASVIVKQHSGVFTSTDIDGNYSIRITDSTQVTLVFSFVSMATQEINVHPKNGEVVVVNVQLKEDNKELGAVVIEKKARTTSDVHLERMRINSAASIDYISGEAMLRTGDGDASAAVKRVTGVSTTGAFVSVRGLADRYIVTTINGSRVPTLDPFTNNLKLDLFPTGLLDNIVITKTATPELAGDWSGASVSLNTSDYPEKLRVSVSSTFGFAPNSSFQTIVSSVGSSTDWRGRDDGLRGIPNGVSPDVEQFPRFIEPALYQQLVLLGLQGTLNAYGITPNTPGFQTSTMSTNSNLQVQHLPLVNLGLLAPALLNDANAVSNAVQTYNSTYNLAYFSPRLNCELASLNKKFDNSRWRVTDKQGSPNMNQSFTIGNQLELFKKAHTPKTLGYLFGIRYYSETEYDGASTLERTEEPFDDTAPGDQFTRKGTQRISTESNGWNAIGSLSLKLDRNNSISLLAMPNVLGQNNARILTFKQPSINGETFVSEDQFYEQRELWVYQFGSRHFIPGLRTKIEADASWSNGSRDVLDLKTVQYILPADGGSIDNVDGALNPPSRIYRFLNETLLDTRLSIEVPLTSDERKKRSLRFGGSLREDERKNQQSYFTVLGAPGPSQWEQPGRFDMRPDGTFTSMYFPFGTFKDNDIGISRITAGFLMADYALMPRLRVVGGVRAEHTYLITDILRYYEEGLAADDPARGTVGDVSIGSSASPEPKPARPGKIDRLDPLPSLNLIYKLKDDEITPMNLRVNYFRSIGRPSFREFSVVQLYDYVLNAPVFGNPDLKLTTIDNYDVRLERFFSGGNNVSLSGFYKHFQNHIELLATLAGGFTWRNAPESYVYGAELEGRVKLMPHLEWRGNLTLMESNSRLETNVSGETTSYTTPMFGQAPYIVNSMLTWTADSARLSISVSYNVQGPKLAVSNSELDPKGIRAYEMPRHLIDITVNKQFGKHWGLRLRGRNLLNTSQRRTYLFNSGYDIDFDKYTYGPEYALTVSYTIR